MKQLKYIALSTLFLVAITSCKKENIDYTNEALFNLMWTDFDENYAGFEARNVDWDSVYQVYHPQAQNSATEDDLWRIFTESLDVLYDAHVYLDRPEEDGFESGSLYADPNIQFEFDGELVKTYLEPDAQSVSTTNDYAFYGKIQNENIGYINIHNFGSDYEGWEEDFDQAVEDLLNTNGIIIDVRNNPGGTDQISSRIAGVFAETTELAYLKKTKNGPGKNDFDEPKSYYTEPQGAFQYTKPVIVLINSYSTSAAEVFGLYMQTQNHITFVGIPTATAFSDVSFVRFLPNGWGYTLSHQLYYYLDGTSPEGIGILPDIELRNDPDDVAAGVDEVLEKGIELLQ